jgi:hypothetical protein
MSSDLKVTAANKMKQAIGNPTANISFTHDELVALRNDRLGDIINKFENVLPKQYHESVKVDRYNLSIRTW